MRNKFYKERFIPFRICKKCGVEYRPQGGEGVLGPLAMKYRSRCWPHRQQWLKRIRKRNYKFWLRWVNENLQRRRELALLSYHKHKNDLNNKKRRHRRTQPLKVETS